MNNATINVVCYKWKTLANGEHPLMLRVTKDGKAKYQSLGISVNSKHWNFKKNEPKPKCPNFEQIQKIILDKKLEVQKKLWKSRSCLPPRASFIDPLRQNMIDPLRQNKNAP